MTIYRWQKGKCHIRLNRSKWAIQLSTRKQCHCFRWSTLTIRETTSITWTVISRLIIRNIGSIKQIGYKCLRTSVINYPNTNCSRLIVTQIDTHTHTYNSRIDLVTDKVLITQKPNLKWRARSTTVRIRTSTHKHWSQVWQPHKLSPFNCSTRWIYYLWMPCLTSLWIRSCAGILKRSEKAWNWAFQMPEE